MPRISQSTFGIHDVRIRFSVDDCGEPEPIKIWTLFHM